VTTHAITVGGYLVLLAIGFVLWFTTRTDAHPRLTSLSKMFEHLLRYRGTRLGLIIFWWWLGWHFLVNVVHY
jgi:hypothetical protein